MVFCCWLLGPNIEAVADVVSQVQWARRGQREAERDYSIQTGSAVVVLGSQNAAGIRSCAGGVE